MITVGLTLVFAVAGAAWRVGMRLGGVEQGVVGCDDRLRELHENFGSMSATRERGYTPTSRAFGPR